MLHLALFLTKSVLTHEMTNFSYPLKLRCAITLPTFQSMLLEQSSFRINDQAYTNDTGYGQTEWIDGNLTSFSLDENNNGITCPLMIRRY